MQRFFRIAGRFHCPVIEVNSLAFLTHRLFKGRAFLPAQTTRSGFEGSKPLLSPTRIEAADIMRHLHQLGRGQRFEVFDDGFQYAPAEKI